jgi:hypothetical protein
VSLTLIASIVHVSRMISEDVDIYLVHIRDLSTYFSYV